MCWPPCPTRLPTRPSALLLGILETKGHLRHVKDGARYVYLPTRPRANAARSALRQVMQTFFGGSVEQTVATLLSVSETPLSPEELDAAVGADRKGKRVNMTRGQTKRAFTLIEIIVVIAILALLAALLSPIFFHARKQARNSACLSNLRQLGLATQVYENDFDGHLPAEDPGYIVYDRGAAAHIHNPLEKYGMIPPLFRCPEAGKWYITATDYDIRFVLMPLFLSPINGVAADNLRLEPEPGTVLAFCHWHLEDAEHINYGQNPDGSLFWRNKGFFNVLRADGSVSKVDSSQVHPQAWDWGEYAGKYQKRANEYELFPGEPWPPRLTQVEMAPD